MPADFWLAEQSLGTLTEPGAGQGAYSIGVELRTRERIAFFAQRIDAATEPWAMEIYARIGTVWSVSPIAARRFVGGDDNEIVVLEGPPEVRLRVVNVDGTPVDVLSAICGYTTDQGIV